MIKLERVYLIIFTVILISLASSIQAQRVIPNRWYVAADGGVSVFFGDVKRYEYIPDYETPSEIQPMLSGSVGKEISPVFSLRAQVLYGELSGHKKSAHYNFTSTLLGAHLMTDINLVYLFTGARFGSTRLNVLTSLGAGYMAWDSKLYYDHPQKADDGIMATSYDGNLSFPGSLSFEYMLSKSLSVNMQGMLYVIASDEVDAKPGGIKIDMVNYNSVGLVYRISTPKRKAKRRQIKYALDPALYEPKKEEVLEEVAAVKPEEENLEFNEQYQEIPKEEKIAKVEEPKENQIDHEIEKRAIEKEVWAPWNEDAWPDIEFTVQVSASKFKQIAGDIQNKYGITEKISERYDGEWYRYSVGSYEKLWRAKETRNILRSESGIENAFIVVYKNDQKITLSEALNEMNHAQKEVVQDDEILEEKMDRVFPMIELSDNIPKSGYFVGVQVLSLKNDYYPMGVFNGIYDISKPLLVYKQGLWNKIIIGGFDSLAEADSYQYVAREKGFIDAFIVVFKDGKRVSLKTYQEEFPK